MTPGRWQQVKAIVADAIGIAPLERAAFVREACAGDTVLEAEVELLLRQDAAEIDCYADDSAFLVRGEEDSHSIGRQVGAYELIRELGRGGMGTVWLAKRADRQFEKVVAAKLLKRGTDTDEVLRRFQAERQILARLEHPNIARLLDGGMTDDGLPYFVMEYVEGKPLTEFCRGNAPTIEERLRLFLKICDAVKFAHQNLIVHRDLKPGNILVTKDGEPKLLDFGIAKLLAPGDGELEATISDHQRLTPAYASPEQVRGEPVTTVSDVYALGTLLFEVLTGQHAHRFSTPHPAPTELLRVVAQEEPLSPSVAATDPATKRRLRGDLDKIILKALRKAPARRYDGVASFAEDIQRHLKGLPVRARKDTAAYRLSKFVRRNKLGVAAAATVALALIGGIAATFWEAKQARRQETIAQERFREVRELAHSVLFDYHDKIATLPGSTAVRERLVTDSLKYLDRLAQAAGNDLSLQQELVMAYLKVGDIQGRGAAANLGNTKGAFESYQKSLVIGEKMIILAPKNPEVLLALATSHERLGEANTLTGNPANAVQELRRALSMLEELHAADPTDALYQAALAISHRVLAQVLGVPSVVNLGDTKGALEHLQKAATLYETLPDQDLATVRKHSDNLILPFSISEEFRQENLSYVYEELATVLEAIGNKAKALEDRKKSVTLLETLVTKEPRNILFRRNLAVTYGNIASALLNAGDVDGALTKHRQALALYEDLMGEDPNNLNARKDLALGYRNMGKVLESKDRSTASSYYRKALDILEGLVAKDQGNAFLQRHLAYTYLRMSMLLADSDDLGAAVEQAGKAIAICESLIAADPKNSTARNTLALSYAQLGKTYSLLASKAGGTQRKEKWQSAKNWYQKSLAIWQDMKTRGTLSGADAGKPDELAKEIATCDAASNSIDLEKPTP